MFPSKTFSLPDWVTELIGNQLIYPSSEDRMALAIQLAEKNIQHGGGPFGACVFESESGKLIAPGVNLVMQQNCSLAHAEAVAIMLAQHICGTYDLGSVNIPSMELVSSAQPCIQCYGNLWWSGIKRLVIGATTQDVEEITGFQEGPLPHDWILRLEKRSPLPSIEVITNVRRQQAREVLKIYIQQGGNVYNPGL
jgi:tRNA(Arg) A34 adenosine deaminase TadA